MMKLYGNPGWGSAIIDLQLTWYGMAFEPVTVGNVFTDKAAAERLRAVNPLAQLPALELDDGTVMTESAAITLLLAELARKDDLVPSPGSGDHAPFLRWLIFLVANIYPCFTYADEPSRFVSVEVAQQPFKQAVDEYEKRLWLVMEEAAGEKYFLGGRMTAIDFYIAVMTRWRPKREWFAGNAPKLHAIAERIDAKSTLKPAWARNGG